MSLPEELVRRLSAAQQEALRVGDSPLRADQLADKLPGLAREIAAAEIPDDQKSRRRAALADAERLLRRDDDGREAARHLQAAQRLAEDRPRRPSPFADD